MTTTDEAVVDEAPSAPTPREPAPRASLGSLLFRQPDEPIPSPSTSPEVGMTGPHAPPGSSPSASGSLDDDQWSDGSDPTSSLASSAEDLDSAAAKAAALVSKQALKKTFRQGVRITGGVAHKVGARTPGQVEVGLYLADEDDAAGIGDPLAEIAHRREGLGGKLSPDANNALQAVMALGGYIAKQIANLKMAAEHDQAFHGQGPGPQAHPNGTDL